MVGVVQSRFNIDEWKITSTVNSVILGQSLKSRGRKSNGSIAAAKPFTFYVNVPLTKRRKKQEYLRV